MREKQTWQKVQMSISKPKFKSCLQKWEKLSQYHLPLNFIENEVKPLVMIDKKVKPGLIRAEKTYFWWTFSTEVGETVLLNTVRLPKRKDDQLWIMIELNRRKSNFGRSVRHFTDTQSELKSRERFAALGPIVSRIRRRTIEIADLLRLAA